MKLRQSFRVGAIMSISALLAWGCRPNNPSNTTVPVLGYRHVQLLKADGLPFKDLNGNGRLDAYEDWRLTPLERSVDLTARMSLEQKAGFMLISSTRMPPSGRTIGLLFCQKHYTRHLLCFT